MVGGELTGTDLICADRESAGQEGRQAGHLEWRNCSSELPLLPGPGGEKDHCAAPPGHHLHLLSLPDLSAEVSE